MQRLTTATHVALDKTGTVTEGAPRVAAVVPAAGAVGEVLRIAAALEDTSTHPFAGAIVAHAKAHGISRPKAEDVTNLPGLGIRGRLGDEEVWVGRKELFHADASWAEAASRLETALTATDSRSTILVGHERLGVVGAIAMEDALREDAAWAIRQLRARNITPVMLTGDTASAAAPVAAAAGIDDVRARLTPAEKLEAIRALQRDGARVAMVGDGINDAPALKAADVGIAMGAGTDIAIEAADITLTASGLLPVVAAVELTRGTFRKIRGNLRWALAYNLIALPLAILGVLHPLIAEAAMAFSSINVVSNSLRLRRLRLPTRASLDGESTRTLQPRSRSP
jgi:Cu+-exporting ATPase